MTHSDGLIRPGSPAPDRTPVCGRQVNPGADGFLDALEQLGTGRRVVAG